MEVLLLGGLVTLLAGLAAWYVNRLASERADRVRRADPAAADKLDQYRFDRANRAALPMKVRGFDKPR